VDVLLARSVTFAMIDVRDIAAVAPIVLTRGTEHDAETHVLTGPESLAAADIARRIERVVRRQVRHTDPSIDAAVEAPCQRGAPPYLRQHMREVSTLFKQGAGAQVTHTVRDITGESARTIDALLGDHADTFQADRSSIPDGMAHAHEQRRG
jgi:uncharacterized protein YbjT (DUF2867 family)